MEAQGRYFFRVGEKVRVVKKCSQQGKLSIYFCNFLSKKMGIGSIFQVPVSAWPLALHCLLLTPSFQGRLVKVLKDFSGGLYSKK